MNRAAVTDAKQRPVKQARRRGGKVKGMGPDKNGTVTPLKSENHLIDSQWDLMNPSKGDVSKEALPLVIKTLRLCDCTSLHQQGAPSGDAFGGYKSPFPKARFWARFLACLIPSTRAAGIRTLGLHDPNVALYQAELRPVDGCRMNRRSRVMKRRGGSFARRNRRPVSNQEVIF